MRLGFGNHKLLHFYDVPQQKNSQGNDSKKVYNLTL
jgi:hypothetical protein